MRLEIRMPRISEYSDEGTIAKWRVSVGDVVRKGDVIADLEVDFTTIELKAEADGKVAEIWVHAGQSVPVETVIAMQAVEAAAAPSEAPSGEEAPAEGTADAVPTPAADTEEFPELGDAPLPAETSGTSSSQDSGGGAVVQNGHVLASPAAVQLAEQYNVNLETLTGTGPCGRIEREDVEAAMQTSSQFITAEDVDDLMSFDGDFSSNFTPSEGTADMEAAGNSEVAEDTEATDVPEPVADETSPVADDSGETAQQESAAAVTSDNTRDVVDDVTAAEESPATEIETEPFVESAAESPLAEAATDAAGAGGEGQVAGIAEAATEIEIEVPAPDTEESPEGDAAAEPDGQEPAEADETVEGETTDTPGVIYMDAGPGFTETKTGAESVGLVDDEPVAEEGPDSEAVDAPGDDSIADSQDETDIDVSFETANENSAVPGDPGAGGVAADGEDEADALPVDESDTIEADEERAERDPEEEPQPALDDSAAEPVDSGAGAEPLDGLSRKSVKVRRLVARKMQESWSNAPHFFVTVAVDMTDVIRFRTDLGVTINDFILAATSRALQEHPWVNSHFIDDEAVEQDEVNISLAVETETGLYYPVVKNCGGKSLKDIGLDAAEMVVKAHSGKLTEEDMEGGTFTISNMGMLGVESFGAIISPPQVAVLAVGTVKGEVVVDEHEEMVMAPMVRLTLSADHRALDGADAADFLGTMKSYLEAPITLVASHDS